jgi:hypothetical protein
MAKRLGTRNIAPDARQAHVLGRQGSYLTRSVLDTWDALTALHYGGREGICSHFREGTIAETGMAWAGAPFAVPGTVNLENSVLLAVTLTRSFLYQPLPATNTYTKRASVALFSVTLNDLVGLRLDDASDNNYLEVVLMVSQASPTQWTVRTRRRTGGGAVTTQDGDAMNTDPGFILAMVMTGTRWSAWNAYPALNTNMGFAGRMFKPYTTLGAVNLAFTPTRAGIVFEPGAIGETNLFALVDWFDIGRA